MLARRAARGLARGAARLALESQQVGLIQTRLWPPRLCYASGGVQGEDIALALGNSIHILEDVHNEPAAAIHLRRAASVHPYPSPLTAA